MDQKNSKWISRLWKSRQPLNLQMSSKSRWFSQNRITKTLLLLQPKFRKTLLKLTSRSKIRCLQVRNLQAPNKLKLLLLWKLIWLKIKTKYKRLKHHQLQWPLLMLPCKLNLTRNKHLLWLNPIRIKMLFLTPIDPTHLLQPETILDNNNLINRLLKVKLKKSRDKTPPQSK